MKAITLNHFQWKVIDSLAPFTHFVGGLGSAKTFTLGYNVLEKARIPGTVHLIAGPTYRNLNTATLKRCIEVWKLFGLKNNIHYVINKQPPKSWNVEPFSGLDSGKVITFYWGSYILVASLENPQAIAGVEYDTEHIDEYLYVKPEARKIIIQRNRGEKHTYLNNIYNELEEADRLDEFEEITGVEPNKTKFIHQIFYYTTPPNDPTEYLKIQEDKPEGVNLIRCNTMANAHNLPKGYINNLRNTLDPLIFRRDVLGELVRMVDNPFMYAFNREKHVKPCKYDENHPLWLSFDFNVNPMTCSVAQWIGNEVRVIDSIEVKNSSTEEICNRIKAKYPDANYIVTGDASGAHRSTQSNRSNYIIIRDALRLSNQQIRVRKKNRPHSESREVCNSILTHTSVVINPSCKALISDLETAKVDVFAQLVKDRKEHKNDHLDNFRYLIDAIYPDAIKNLQKLKKAYTLAVTNK